MRVHVVEGRRARYGLGRTALWLYWISHLASSRSLSVFFNDTATTEIYTRSLHDALPIWRRRYASPRPRDDRSRPSACRRTRSIDRKSTRLYSSHDQSSYAVFCLKKNKKFRGGNQHHNKDDMLTEQKASDYSV